MIYVHNDDAVYLWWLERTANGFVANLRTGGKTRAMLHESRCSHLYPLTPGKVHTVTYPKACSIDRSEVEQWVRDAGYALVLCPDCEL